MTGILPLSGTYSFLDVQCTLLANSMGITLSENGIAEEGLVYRMAGPKNTRTMGADGSGMMGLHASNAGDVTVNLLKASPVNAQLNALYRFQQSSGAFWGNIQITINSPVFGDNIVCNIGAFSKHADVVYDVPGRFLVWEFQFISIIPLLGNGYNPSPLNFTNAIAA
jgi:hypothetical protein